MASTVQNELPGPLVIWLLIVEYLTDQNDLSSVSLSCRQLHRIAARQRWRRISIDLPDESLRRLLRPGCIPSRNIRHIELRDHHNQDFSLTPMLDSLTHSLEFGALRAVTAEYACCIPGDALADLYVNQPALETLLVPDSSEFSINRYHSFSNISYAHIRTSASNVVKLRGLFIRMPLLRTLELEGTASENCGLTGLTRYDPPISARSSKNIIRALFSSVFSKRKEPLLLRTLNLKGFNLETSSFLLRQAIRFYDIESLTLQQCSSILTLLEACCGYHEPKSLRHLLITSTTNIQANPLTSTATIDNFLEAALNLQSLVIDAQFDKMLEPSIRSFAKPSLEILMLRCSVPHPFTSVASYKYWSNEELEYLVRSSPNLKELGINFPPLSLTHYFEEGDLAADAPHYHSFTATLSNLYSLTDLQDFSSPYFDPDNLVQRLESTRASDVFIECQHRLLAEAIMKIVPRTSFVTVGSGTGYLGSLLATTYHKHSYRCNGLAIPIAINKSHCQCREMGDREVRKGKFVR